MIKCLGFFLRIPNKSGLDGYSANSTENSRHKIQKKKIYIFANCDVFSSFGYNKTEQSLENMYIE